MRHLMPVYAETCADPFVWRYGDCHYAVATSPAGADGRQFALLRSSSLKKWEKLGWAPKVAVHDGKYYCFYSGGCFQNDTYGVDYVVADSVLGPYCHVNDSATVLRSIPGRLIGPGHNSTVTDSDDNDYIVYHAWDEVHTGRRMHISELAWTPDGPKAVID